MGMRGFLKRVVATLILGFTHTALAELNLYTFNAPPYQVVDRDSAIGTIVRGETVEAVVCGVGLAGSSVSVRVAPQNRAVHALRRNLIDGYFAIDSSDELDRVGVPTAPIALEKWYFFSGKADIDPRNARLGVVSGSNEELWLKRNGYDVFLGVSTVEQLIALIHRGRIDAALMDKRVMENLHNEPEAPDLVLHHQFLRYTPLHLYLSRSFTANNPGFIDEFNRFIPDCVTPRFELDEHEKELLAAQAELLLSDLKQNLSVGEAIRLGPRVDSFADILTIDLKWQALAPQSVPPMAADILRLPASEQLGRWQAKHSDLVTEAMVTNNLGTVVAMSQLTSDFWQGDEPKFQQIADGGGKTLYLSPIRYDASTQRFQVIASTPILSEEAGAIEGTLVIGLDIEAALSRLDRD
ncbi:MAG: substrate-binding periplasmic protein [Marinobacter sp.]|uniref:substrate-binding periplasmic protein n=1 Tax=Marinobacter sp. TaxID=50741 RepID=UPI003C3B278A